MLLFPEYQVRHARAEGHFRRIRQIGWLPVGLAVILILANPSAASPGLWSAVGVSLGVQLLIAGARLLQSPGYRPSPLGRRLLARAGSWYPLLLFAARYTFILVLSVILWMELTELHYRAAPWHTLVFALVIGLIPVDRLFKEWLNCHPTPAGEIICDLLHYLKLILAVIIGAIVLCAVIVAQSKPYQTETDPFILVIWVLACLVILGYGVLFVDHLRSHRPPRPPPPPPPPAPPETTVSPF